MSGARNRRKACKPGANLVRNPVPCVVGICMPLAKFLDAYVLRDAKRN